VYDPIARDLAKSYLIDRNYNKRDQCESPLNIELMSVSNFGQGYFLYIPRESPIHASDIANGSDAQRGYSRP
jgi:hypothetical protein